MIFTFCYSKGSDDTFVRKIIRMVAKEGGTIHFVHLHCSVKELKKRVKSATRKKTSKIKTIQELEKTLHEQEFYSPIPFVKTLRIDNTHKSARQVAKQIKQVYKL